MSWWSKGKSAAALRDAAESAGKAATPGLRMALGQCARVHLGSFLAERQLKMASADAHRAALVRMGPWALPTVRTARAQLAAQHGEYVLAAANVAHNRRLGAEKSMNDVGADAQARLAEELRRPPAQVIQDQINALDQLIREIEGKR